MSVKKLIEQRRAYRALAPVDVDDSLVRDLATCASLAPSCFNKQPWRFRFVTGGETLDRLFDALSPGNEWARRASMIVAVYSKDELDCLVKGREYYLFDTGLSVSFLVLRATELGLVAHPIAGFDEEEVARALEIPPGMTVITLIVVGRHDPEATDLLGEKQIEAERERPPRLSFGEFAGHDR
ncbi:MAG: nitroreductase family protein [Candidatus Krumholzibacteriota bacterium]|nr:nitroreductase family protein [Candidatus Krumholzibacteriota bacterium]